MNYQIVTVYFEIQFYAHILNSTSLAPRDTFYISFHNCPDSTNAGGDGFFLCDFNLSDLARVRNVRAAAEFLAKRFIERWSNIINFHFFRILFLEMEERAGFLRLPFWQFHILHG